MAVWGHNKLVVIGLSVLLTGQFVIIISAMASVKATYVNHRFGCRPTSVNSNLGTAMYSATMAVDFVVLSLTACKTYVESKTMYHSRLIQLIFRDGLVYFAVV